MPRPKALTGITVTAPIVGVKILQLTVRHETKYNTENIESFHWIHNVVYLG